MKIILHWGIMTIILGVACSAWAAKGAIAQDYHGMWGAGGCSKPKYYLRIEGSGMQMYAADKRMSLGNWTVRNVQSSRHGIVIDTQETNSHQPTHMELTRLPNGHLSLSLSIGGNSGVDELARC